jgi:hypothetical protein
LFGIEWNAGYECKQFLQIEDGLFWTNGRLGGVESGGKCHLGVPDIWMDVSFDDMAL